MNTLTYTQIIKHAALPALMSYIALFYIVHLEACKADIRGIPRDNMPPLINRIISVLLSISGVILLANIVYFGLGWIIGAIKKEDVLLLLRRKKAVVE